MKDGVEIKIKGDDSEFEKTLKQVTKSAQSAASSLSAAYRKAGMEQSEAMSKAWAEVKKAQADGTTVMINGVETVVQKNRELSRSIEDVSETGYRELADSAEAAATQISGSFRKIHKLNVDLSTGISKVGSGIKATFKGISTAVKGISVAVGAISTAVSAAGVASVKYNASVEQLQTSFEVMTGSASRAAEVVQELRDLGASTPYEFTGLAQTVQTLMQYNLASEDAISTTEMIGDIAQGSADKMSSIATAYGQMSSAGKVSLEDVKQMIEAGFNPLLTISNKTGESMASLYERISDGTLAVSEITDAMIAATSEGGQFFQSMQKQSQTLSGQLSTLQDNMQSFGGSLFSGVSTALQTSILPQANDLIAELQNAFEQGGVDGLVNALSKQLPRLTTAGVEAVSKMFAGVSKKLPGLVKSLLSALPSVLGSAVDMVPQLTDALFQLASEATEQLIGMLPELGPTILKGTGKLLSSLGKGVIDLLDGIFSGAGKALKDAGVIEKSIEDAFQDALDNADTSHLDAVVAEIDANITANVTNPEDVIAQVQTAIMDIQNALANIEGLSPDQATKIEAAILTGSGVTLFRETLEGIDVSDTKAKKIAESITGAMSTISNAIETLGLSDEALARLETLVAENATGDEIEAALEGYGIDAETAETTAATIAGAMGSINSAVKKLKLDEETLAALRTAAFNDRNAIVAALQILGIDEGAIQGVLDSYDGISESLTAKAKGIYTYISNMFTDGVPEDDADVQAAKAAVENLFTDAYDRVEQWRDDKVKELEASGLTGDALLNAVGEVDEQYRSIITELNDLEKQSMEWTNQNAQKSTAFVQGNLDQLQNIVDQVSQLSAEIDVMTNEQFNVYRNKRSLVQAGAAQSEKAQLEAFAITAKELEERIQDAESKAGAALDAAAEELGRDAEAYSAREKEILDELAREKQAAYDIYNEETQKTLAGILKADPETYAQFMEIADEMEIARQAEELQKRIVDAIEAAAYKGETVDISTFFENLTAEGLDMAAIAEKLGLTPEELNKQIVNALKSPTADTQLNTALVDYLYNTNIEIANALETGEIDLSKSAPVLTTAIEKDYLKSAVDGVDWTNVSTLFDTMLESIVTDASTAMTEHDFTPEAETMGEEAETAAKKPMRSGGMVAGCAFAEGMTKGMTAKRSSLISVARSLANSVVNALRGALGIHSPSTVAKELGGYFGDGFKIGMVDSMNDALRSIDGIAGTLNLSPRLSAPDLSGEFANMLSNMTLNTEGNQRIALYINGRQLGTVMAEDNRYVQNAYNHSIGMGYGK